MSNVTLKSISKSYGSANVLRNISLDIEEGEFVVFVGPSGCGKSTLLKLIAGLEDISSGALEIANRDVSGLEPVERGIAMVFQSYALYPHLSVFENIAFPLRLQKKDKASIEKAVHSAANILDLNDRLEYKPESLSGGQRQRVAIGRAIVRNPQVFLFDEPLSNLDASLRGQMRVELTELHQTLQTTMIYVTHDQVEAMTMADRIVVLNNGEVEQFGTPMELYHQPKTRFVASFIGQPGMNFIPVQNTSQNNQCTITTACGTDISLYNCDIPTQEHGQLELGIRPEFLKLSSNDNGLEVKVRVIENLGGIALLYGELIDGTRIVASFDGLTDLPQDRVKLTFDPKHAQLFANDGRSLTTTPKSDK